MKDFDLLTFGRSSIDLYSKNIGAEFNDIKELSASIGGCPLNIAVGTKRLGLKSGLFSAIGPDPVGGFIKSTLEKEGVDTQHLNTIEGTTSTAVVLGIIPPDKFPILFYRDNAPDNNMTIDLVNKVDFDQYRSFLMSGTALAVEPTRSAAFYAAERAKEAGAKIVLDIDFRALSWHDIRSFGITLRQFLPLCDVAIGTEEELLALYLKDKDQLEIKNSAMTDPQVKGDIEEAIEKIMQSGIELLLLKRGAKGVTVYHKDGKQEDVPGFPVDVVNILGAGDAFASGFIYGYLQGWDTYKSARLANGCGAWLVTKQGCCNYAPYYGEIINFIESKGGF